MREENQLWCLMWTVKQGFCGVLLFQSPNGKVELLMAEQCHNIDPGMPGDHVVITVRAECKGI